MSRENKPRISIQVQPNASRNEVRCFKDGVLHVRIAAPPVKGKANQELIKFLSEIFNVSKSELTIVKGMSSKKKIIAVDGLTQTRLQERIEKLGAEE